MCKEDMGKREMKKVLRTYYRRLRIFSASLPIAVRTVAAQLKVRVYLQPRRRCTILLEVNFLDNNLI